MLNCSQHTRGGEIPSPVKSWENAFIMPGRPAHIDPGRLVGIDGTLPSRLPALRRRLRVRAGERRVPSTLEMFVVTVSRRCCLCRGRAEKLGHDLHLDIRDVLHQHHLRPVAVAASLTSGRIRGRGGSAWVDGGS